MQSFDDLPSLDEAMSSPVWDLEFWDALERAEEIAKDLFWQLGENASEGTGCDCDTCIVRTILEAIWPTMTVHAQRLVYGEVNLGHSDV